MDRSRNCSRSPARRPPTLNHPGNPPRLAVFGATGAVGGVVCRLLEERNFPWRSLRLFGSPGRTGRTMTVAGCEITVEPLEAERVHDLDLVIASTPDEVAAGVADRVVGQGGVLVDESAAHRMNPDVPLVVPEINAAALSGHRGIVASPNCSTTQLVLCLQPLQREFGIRRVVVSTYQAASGAGTAAVQELREGTRAVLDGRPPLARVFELPLALNLLPRIGGWREAGQTSEEAKMVAESRKILGLPELRMIVTCVRVPVENCHSESVVVETRQPVDPQRVRELLAASPGIQVLDDPRGDQVPTPRRCHDQDDVLVGRIRPDDSVEHGIAFWCVGDNLRKGAATNAVQIAEALVEANLIRPRD